MKRSEPEHLTRSFPPQSGRVSGLVGSGRELSHLYVFDCAFASLGVAQMHETRPDPDPDIHDLTPIRADPDPE
jgi:hypothetical protein